MILIDKEQKEKWEAKIAELENIVKDIGLHTEVSIVYRNICRTRIELYTELLSQATVVHTEKYLEFVNKHQFLEEHYPNGVIIKK